MDWQSTGSEIPQEVETPQEVESQRKFIGTPQEVDWQHTGSRIPEEVDWNPTGSRTPQEVLTGARESESSSSRRSEAEGRKKKKELLNLEGKEKKITFCQFPPPASRGQQRAAEEELISMVSRLLLSTRVSLCNIFFSTDCVKTCRWSGLWPLTAV